MNILMVGGGGREHALILALKKDKRVTKVFCAPGNGGISRDAVCLDIKADDISGIVGAAKENHCDLVFVAPDDPLAAGMVDALEKEGIRAFGPHADAAEIESSKVFSKDLMKKYKIPTAGYEVFDDPSKALEYIKDQGKYPAVIKADGLALGKGVVIAEKEQQASDALDSIMKDKVFGASGNKVVIEEFLEGPEVSVLSFTDGKCVKPMVSSMDHKRALNDDKGLNTGGMGTVSPNPFYDEKTAQRCMDEIFIPTMNAMNKEGRTFKGCLYFGLMLTKDGPKVIEYNSRFGDPETQVVLPRLETSLLKIVDAVIDGTLSDLDIKWSGNACACVVMASGGYPVKYEKNKEIFGLDTYGQIDADDVTVYHAGTKYENGKFYTAGGRVLGVSAVGSDLDDALCKAYNGVAQISFEKMHYRTDIGAKR
jgi:phosphoribosylamine--glycine ligase